MKTGGMLPLLNSSPPPSAISPGQLRGMVANALGGNRARIGDLERPLSGGQTRADEGPLLAVS
jgi:hypothetical protein